MGKLMKDVPATRYSLLDRPSAELRKAELLRNFAEDAQSDVAPRSFDHPLVTEKNYQSPRNTAQELEAYLQHAYRR
jgi:hypothetical protein